MQHLKKPQVPAISMGSYPISARAVYATSGSVRQNKAHKSHTEMPFLFLLVFYFVFFFLLGCFCLYFFTLDFVKHKEMCQNLLAAELFIQL